MPSKNFTCRIYGDIPDKKDPVSLQIIKQTSKLFSQLYLKPKGKKQTPVRALSRQMDQQRKLVHQEEETEALPLHQQQMGSQSPEYLLHLQNN